MNDIIRIEQGSSQIVVQAIVGESAMPRFLEFFTANIRNSNTRRAYMRAAVDFLGWCAERGVVALSAIQPIHVASWIEELENTHSVPTVKLRLAGIRHLFDWMVTGQMMPHNKNTELLAC